jgi:hypothetical protein
VTVLPEAELAFYFAAMATLEPDQQLIYAERVAAILGAYAPICEPGPGDVDRAIRQALVGLWVPPPATETLRPARWHRRAPRFERVSREVV